MISLGIDPGTSGGIGLIFPDDEIKFCPLPTFTQLLKGKNASGKHKQRNHADVNKAVKLIWEMTGIAPQFWSLRLQLCVEFLQSGGKFADTTGQLMKNYGRLLAIFELYDIPKTQPTPRMWQKWIVSRMSLQARAKAQLLYPDDTKGLSIEYVHEHFPEVNLILKGRRNPHDGCADAICQADYARHHPEECKTLSDEINSTAVSNRRRKVRAK